MILLRWVGRHDPQPSLSSYTLGWDQKIFSCCSLRCSFCASTWFSSKLTAKLDPSVGSLVCSPIQSNNRESNDSINATRKKLAVLKEESSHTGFLQTNREMHRNRSSTCWNGAPAVGSSSMMCCNGSSCFH